MDDGMLKQMEAIILSMTPYERENPNVLNHSRKRRIAAGAGVPVEEINKLLKQFETMQALVRQMSGPGAKKRMRGMAKFGGGMPGGFRLPGM